METRVEKPWLLRLEEEYVGVRDWEVRENANTNVSYSSLRNYIFSKLVKREDVLSQYLPREAVRMHVRGDIYIHKLPDSLWIPYCTGVSMERLLMTGLRSPTIVSRPARHFDTAVSHLINLFFNRKRLYNRRSMRTLFCVGKWRSHCHNWG